MERADPKRTWISEAITASFRRHLGVTRKADRKSEELHLKRNTQRLLPERALGGVKRLSFLLSPSFCLAKPICMRWRKGFFWLVTKSRGWYVSWQSALHGLRQIQQSNLCLCCQPLHIHF